MKVMVFDFDANPAVDAPRYRLTRRRAQDMIDRELADLIGPYALKERPPVDDQPERPGSVKDWYVSRVSRLPDGKRLHITTRQRASCGT